MIIVGAGLAGLIAAHVFKSAVVLESGSKEQMAHKALLRFRTGSVGDACGIEFKKVRVYKAVAFNWQLSDRPSIPLANMYSKKVLGKTLSRSIWNLDPCDRYVAPDDLVAQLVESVGERIVWDTSFDFAEQQTHQQPIISTIPMPALAKMLRIEHNEEFAHAPITVRRWRVKGCDVYQTVYFPDPAINLYRASITGDLLIAEFVNRGDWPDADELFSVFGLTQNDVEEIDSSNQRFGKIAPINDQWRREFVFRTTIDHGIYSLGRFATWRNILLDDVLHDVHVIKGLIGSDNYGTRRASGLAL